jgi:AraC-like DNA-binding protein
VTETGRDRLRELLDAVLAGTVTTGAGGTGRRSLGDMAGGAASSPFHFNRQMSAATGEPPVAMRRRVLLERAAWQLARGTSVTDAAWAAGYGSVEGFSRAFSAAFGRSPSASAPPDRVAWLPAPNGIHFHPPMSLWVSHEEQPMNPLIDQLVAHDLDDTRALLDAAKGLPADELQADRFPGLTVTAWDGPEGSIAAVLENHLFTKEVWLAAIEGLDIPTRPDGADVGALVDRHEAVAARWLATIRRIDARGGWDDVLIDALCDPPESFVMSGVVAHVVTFAAHRRQLVRRMLALAGHPVDDGDPIMWLRSLTGVPPETYDTRDPHPTTEDPT